jgi:hypothetical protein
MSGKLLAAFAPYSPCQGQLKTAHATGMTGYNQALGFQHNFMSALRFQSSGRTQLWCANICNVCASFRAAGLSTARNIAETASAFKKLDARKAAKCCTHGFRLYHTIADEGDVVYLPSGWLLGEKSLSSQMVLRITAVTFPDSGSLGALRCIRDLLAFDNPSSPALENVDENMRLVETYYKRA